VRIVSRGGESKGREMRGWGGMHPVMGTQKKGAGDEKIETRGKPSWGGLPGDSEVVG